MRNGDIVRIGELIEKSQHGGVFGASFALMLALPAGAGRRRPETADNDPGADDEATPADVAATGEASNGRAAHSAVTS